MPWMEDNEFVLNQQVLAMNYLLTAVTGLGYLALTWSTVVLLGGFVTSLELKDFWCLTLISLIQAARSGSVSCTALLLFISSRLIILLVPPSSRLHCRQSLSSPSFPISFSPLVSPAWSSLITRNEREHLHYISSLVTPTGSSMSWLTTSVPT